MDTDNQKDSQKDSKSDKAGNDYPIIKIQLPREAALKAHLALQTLKERKADIKADELLAEFLDGITEEYLDAQIEKRTPEDYYFEAAKSIPELREKIIQQTKKALQRTDKAVVPNVAPAEPKKAKKKEKAAGTPSLEPVGEIVIASADIGSDSVGQESAEAEIFIPGNKAHPEAPQLSV